MALSRLSRELLRGSQLLGGLNGEPGNHLSMPRSAVGLVWAAATQRPETFRRCGVVLALLMCAVIVIVLVSCQAEGGWYCTTYGHPHPALFKKIYELHGGEYGDLIFGSAQAILIETLVAFPSVRKQLRRRRV